MKSVASPVVNIIAIAIDVSNTNHFHKFNSEIILFKFCFLYATMCNNMNNTISRKENWCVIINSIVFVI